MKTEAKKIERDDIIRMARECGHWSGQTVEMNDVGLERFAALVAAAEREACANFIEHDYVRQFEKPWREDLSAAIRARGNT